MARHRLPTGLPTTSRAALLAGARAAGACVIHIVHRGAAGGAFDRVGWRGAIVDALMPRDGEMAIEKPRPSSFSGTDLGARLVALGRPPLVVAGCTTHMRVSTTVRAALDEGFAVTVAADACATRDLPNPPGGVIRAETIHAAALAALADRFALVTKVGVLAGSA
ncbi:isochorismatase family protein [Chelatococcus sp. SYSU_G07232]|uniref:Isochorismatase family protein n=1 Tax=Chelatococcus albus TaxID=3047466 RepID=A0ABT7ADB9_9HYPH|nr:isochorismatase family protein [Chelatococcus sp. SYSU_G07232]MDJ1157354.1 isochorismatase family protein [Chelatococcus sp. SYSU_G07232]